MPSTTPKQKRTMAAAAHNPAFAKKVGIPVDVAKDFNRADTGTSMRMGQSDAEYAKGGPILRRTYGR